MKKKRDFFDGETDRRILEKKLASGEITPKEWKEYLECLPDLSDEAEQIVIEEKFHSK